MTTRARHDLRTVWQKREARSLDNRRRGIVAELQTRGWTVRYWPVGIQVALPPVRSDAVAGAWVWLPGTLTSERQARNLETALRSIGPYPREERR